MCTFSMGNKYVVKKRKCLLNCDERTKCICIEVQAGKAANIHEKGGAIAHHYSFYFL